MCTVTFVPVNDGFIITSNRDEQVKRPPAALPEPADFGSGKMLFPKDGLAGGTWIAQHSNGNFMVLLNGAFEKHIPQYPYRKSRGLVFLDIFDGLQPVERFLTLPLDDIEPFTLVIWQNNRLWEARWDGAHKYCVALVATMPHMWQSVTLYEPEVRKVRAQWFTQWLEATAVETTCQTRQFHEFGGDGDEQNALKMNRNGVLKTVSITSVHLKADESVFYYKDLAAGIATVHHWYFAQPTIIHEANHKESLCNPPHPLGILEQ